MLRSPDSPWLVHHICLDNSCVHGNSASHEKLRVEAGTGIANVSERPSSNQALRLTVKHETKFLFLDQKERRNLPRKLFQNRV